VQDVDDRLAATDRDVYPGHPLVAAVVRVVLDAECALATGSGTHRQRTGQPRRSADDALGLCDEHVPRTGTSTSSAMSEILHFRYSK